MSTESLLKTLNATCKACDTTPYGWTALAHTRVTTGHEISSFENQPNAMRCLHLCALENGPDPYRNIEKRCDRVNFDSESGVCRLYDSSLASYGSAPDEDGGNTVYVRKNNNRPYY